MQMSIISFEGILVNKFSTWRLAMKQSGQKLETLLASDNESGQKLETLLASDNESCTKNSLTKRGDKIGTKNLANL